MELCFVLRADIKEDTLLLFGMHGQKVGIQSLSLRNSDGICNANHSVSYCVGPNGPRYTMTGKPKGTGSYTGMQTNTLTRTYTHEHRGAYFKMHSIVIFNFTPF